MDKQKILSQLIIEQENRYNNLVGETKKIIELVNESPSAAESHSDTSRSQNSWLADSTNHKSIELFQQINNAKKYKFNNLEGKIITGNLINLEVNKISGWYFILPFFGGQTIQMESNKIAVINTQSPIAQKIIGQKKGYEFPFMNRNYTIVEVK